MVTRVQNIICDGGENWYPRCFCLFRWGVRIRIRMAANIASTPPSLLGIERKIAYAQRKYHSGIIWIGVTKGFAGMKFSGSLRRVG